MSAKVSWQDEEEEGMMREAGKGHHKVWEVEGEKGGGNYGEM